MIFGNADSAERAQDRGMPGKGGASEDTIPRLRPLARPARGTLASRAEACESFPRLLESRLMRSRCARKGFRTRTALRVAAARLLHERGYERLNAGEIAAAAAQSKATFYVYFRDKAQVAETVLRPFLAYAFPGSEQPDPLQAAFARLLLRVRAHRHLLQGLDLLGRDDPGFAAAAQSRILRWHQQLLERSGRDPDLAPLLAATSLGFAWAPDAGGPFGFSPGLLAEQISRLWRIEGRPVSQRLVRL